jgi:Tol biopolymer transport system component
VIETFDLDRGTRRRLTFESSNALPVWTPDARRIAFASSRDGGWNLYWRAADGSGEATRLLASENELWPHSFSPDGKVLAYWEIDAETARNIWILPLEGDPTPIPFLLTPYNERAPVFSPDGRWISYISDESGRDEVYIRPYPGPGAQTTVSTRGGVEPIWAPDGRRLFYRDANSMMVVSVETRNGISVSKPTVLFEDRYDRGVSSPSAAERRRASGSSSIGLTTCGGCRLPSSPPRGATLRINAVGARAWVPRSALQQCNNAERGTLVAPSLLD